MAECIHGFEGTLCDICFPRQVPDSKRAVATARRSATAAPLTRAASAKTKTPPMLLLGTQRVFHFTHLRNLEAILLDEGLRADATPEVDVSSEAARELRRSVELPSGGTVAEHVAFQLSPNAARWNELRKGAKGAHWSDSARRVSPLEFVILVTTGGELSPDAVLADGDASATVTRFAAGRDDGTALLRRVYAADAELLEPELLVPGPVPFDAIQLIGVPNEPVRDRVKDMLTAVDRHGPRVAVYPPWFQKD